jgi:hypothetical protein
MPHAYLSKSNAAEGLGRSREARKKAKPRVLGVMSDESAQRREPRESHGQATAAAISRILVTACVRACVFLC